MNRAQKLLQLSNKDNIDETLKPFKNKIREALKSESGTKGVRGLLEVASEQMDKINDIDNAFTPNPSSDKDKVSLNEGSNSAKQLAKKIKKIKETFGEEDTKREKDPTDQEPGQ